MANVRSLRTGHVPGDDIRPKFSGMSIRKERFCHYPERRAPLMSRHIQSELATRLVNPAKKCLEDVRKLAACATCGMNCKPSTPFEEFAASILPSRNLSAPGIAIAHASMPRVNFNNTQPPTAIVGLRGNTNPFDKP